jgi:hypothetical protein
LLLRDRRILSPGLTDGLAAVVRQLAERLERDAAGKQADRLLTAEYILTGLRLKTPDELRAQAVKRMGLASSRNRESFGKLPPPFHAQCPCKNAAGFCVT